jgi:two-component system, response regulator, stage 0 sporulation protein F
MNVRKKASILIVDDNEELVESLYLQFSYGGFNVTKATSPIRALELTSLICPDVMIADIRMPKLDGLQLIRKFKEVQPNVKVILMTGYYPEYEQSIKDALEHGLADHVIQKGFRALDIERLVYELLQKPDKKEGDRKVKGRILFVDDEIEVTDFLRDYFIAGEYDASVAKSAEEALVIYESFKPDIVITDIKMPGRDGIWLIDRLRDKNKQVKIIVMTGQDNHPTLQRLKDEAGITEYFSKPFSLKDLEKLSQKLVETSSGGQKINY